MAGDLLTIAEVADLLRFPPGAPGGQAVRRLIRAGELRASLVGKSYLIRRQDVDALIEARATRPAGPVILAGGRTFPG
jgi:excisionase family DNA binding protein